MDLGPGTAVNRDLAGSRLRGSRRGRCRRRPWRLILAISGVQMSHLLVKVILCVACVLSCRFRADHRSNMHRASDVQPTYKTRTLDSQLLVATILPVRQVFAGIRVRFRCEKHALGLLIRRSWVQVPTASLAVAEGVWEGGIRIRFSPFRSRTLGPLYGLFLRLAAPC